MFMGGAARPGGPNPFAALASRYGQKMGMAQGPRPGPTGGATGGFVPPGGGLATSSGPRPGPTGGATGGFVPPGAGGVRPPMGSAAVPPVAPKSDFGSDADVFHWQEFGGRPGYDPTHQYRPGGKRM